MKKFLKEDGSEMNDFQKVMALAKKRLDFGDVEFTDSEGKDYSDFIEITQDGLLFTFDGLSDFLGFFFPDVYGEDNTDGKYEAYEYEDMYSGNYNFYNFYSDDAYNDWTEGYIVGYFNQEHFELLSEIFKYTNRDLIPLLKKYNGTNRVDERDGKKFLSVLGSLGYEDRITELYLDSMVQATQDEIIELLKKRYCNCLEPIGIDNYSSRFCFWKYELSWSGCMLLYARFGVETDKLLDLLHEGINKLPISHLPYPYEIRYEVWNQDKFNSTFNHGLTEILENCLEELKDNTYSDEFLHSLNVVTKLGGVNTWIYSKDKTISVSIRNIDPESGLITYIVTNHKRYENRTSKTNAEDLLNLLNQGRLFETKKSIRR